MNLTTAAKPLPPFLDLGENLWLYSPVLLATLLAVTVQAEAGAVGRAAATARLYFTTGAERPLSARQWARLQAYFGGALTLGEKSI